MVDLNADTSRLWDGNVNAWEKLAIDTELANRVPKHAKGRKLLESFTDFDNILPRDFGDLSADVKNRMVKDPAIAPALEMTVNSVISRGWQLVGGRPDIRAYLQDMLDKLNLDDVFENILTGFWWGFSVTEKVFDQDEDGLYFIKELRTLPQESLEFKMTEKGVLQYVIQDGGPLGYDGKTKFFPKIVEVFTYTGGLSSNFGDLRGISALERIYDDYWSKTMIRRMKDQFLELGAGAILVGNAGEMSVREMLTKVEDLRSGAATVLRKDQTLEFVQPKGDGEIYLDNLAYHDKRMREALLVQLFFGQDGQVSSGVMTKSSFELLARTRIMRFQQQLSDIVMNIFRQIGKPNWGPDADLPDFEFLVATEDELAARAEQDMRLAKMRIIGKKDIDRVRVRHEYPPGDPGESLIEAKPLNPASSGSLDNTAGDHELKDNDDNFTPEAIDDREDNGPEER
jgi:hypothetical protein